MRQMGFKALLDRHERGAPSQVEKPMRWSGSRLHASPFFEIAIASSAHDCTKCAKRSSIRPPQTGASGREG